MIKLYIANLGKYNEGELVGDWIGLPVDEDTFQEFLADKVGINEEYEEYAIHDYESGVINIEISEYDSIEELNTLAEWLDGAGEEELLVFSAILDNGSYSDYEDVCNQVDDGNYRVYHNCYDMEDVAMEMVDDGLLGDMPEILQMYFDYEAYGRDLEINHTFIQVDDCYVEIFD